MARTLHVVPGNPHPLVAPSGSGGVIYRSASDLDLEGSYASVADLDEISVPEGSEGDWGTSLKQRWLRIASRRLDSYVGQRWKVPLQKWSDAWVWAVCEIAFAGMCGKRGYKPGGDSEKTIGERHDEVIHWVEMSRDYEVTPDPRLVLEEPAHVARMTSDVPRGWGGVSPSTFVGPRGTRGRFF